MPVDPRANDRERDRRDERELVGGEGRRRWEEIEHVRGRHTCAHSSQGLASRSGRADRP